MVGEVAPVDKTVTYGTELTSLSGASKCWITQNLGSSNQATAPDDATEASSGWYWQFNRKQGYKHDGTTRTPGTAWITSISETSDWLPANDPCTIEFGTGWRIPTFTEWTNADANGAWTTYTNTYGSVLKIAASGFLSNTDGTLDLRGTNGYYWSSSQYDATHTYFLRLLSSGSNMASNFKAYGFTLRCLRD